MARPLRIEYEGAIYHVTSRGNAGMNIFRSDSDRQLFLKTLADVIDDMGWLCHSYCLMDNHYHLVIETPNANLGKGMRQLNGVYTQRFNRIHQQTGHLFQGRYKAVVVEADSYFLEVVRYVVLNPVRAGMVKDAQSWPWSSYRAVVGLESSPGFLSTERVLSHFSSTHKRAIASYSAFVTDGVDARIWDGLNRQVYLGSDTFVASVHQQVQGSENDKNIPKQQRQAPAKSLQEITVLYPQRNDAIVAAYRTGVYSYSQIADFFGICFTTVGRIVRAEKQERYKSRPDPIKKKSVVVKPKADEGQRQLSLI